MIETILDSLKKDISNRKDLFEKLDDLIARIDFMSTVAFILKKASQLFPNNIKNFLPDKKDIDKILGREKYKSLIESVSKGNTSKFIEQFRSMFEELVVDADYKVVVVYIDDLDRCDPKRIIDCLEAVKLFVNVKRTAFVIGADERIIEYAIQLHYPIEQKKEEISSPFSDYLEKLIQLPYKIPRLSGNEQETYITLLLYKYYLSPLEFERVYQLYEKFRQKDKHSMFNIDNINKQMSEYTFHLINGRIIMLPLITRKQQVKH